MDNTSEKEYDKELSKNLIQYLSNIIDGNNATINDVKSIDYEVENITAELNIIWVFFGEYAESSKAGGSYIGESCNSIYELKNITNKLIEKAKFDKNLRIPFINTFKELERDGISKANKNYIIKDFGKFSTKETCHTCNGKCKITCNSCRGNGKHRCNYCSGTGSTQTTYRNHMGKLIYTTTSCYYCSGRGNKACYSCSGSGKVRCDNCNGHGYFIITHDIVAKAKPEFIIKTDSKFANNDLEQFLKKKNLLFLNDTIDFKYINKNMNRNDDKEIFTYIGNSVIIKQNFSVHSKEYTCYAFSNPPISFIKPTIFNDLFINEIKFINNLESQKKYISTKEALNFFDSYSKLPALNEAMKEIANVRKKTKEDTTNLIIKATHGFISNNIASILSNHINKFMDKISPTYSPLIWVIGLLFSFIVTIVFFEYSVEEQGTKIIFDSIIKFVIMSFILIVIIYPLDLLLTLLKRMKIPTEYRQKLRYKEPLKLFTLGSFIILSLVLSYGILSNKNYVPKSNGMPQYIALKILNDGCEIFKDNNLDICEKIDFNKVITYFPVIHRIPIHSDEIKYINKLRREYTMDIFYLQNNKFK